MKGKTVIHWRGPGGKGEPSKLLLGSVIIIIIFIIIIKKVGSASLRKSRFAKSTHISMISNSVTHLRSYTNSAIADITGNSA